MRVDDGEFWRLDIWSQANRRRCCCCCYSVVDCDNRRVLLTPSLHHLAVLEVRIFCTQTHTITLRVATGVFTLAAPGYQHWEQRGPDVFAGGTEVWGSEALQRL